MTASTCSPDQEVAERLEALACQARVMWRYEPAATGEHRTEVLTKLHGIRAEIERLELRSRAGLINASRADEEIRRWSHQLDVLQTRWPH